MANLIELCSKNLRDILRDALRHPDTSRALVIYDTESELSRILTAAYREALPQALFLDFAHMTQESIREAIDVLSPRDLVVLVQSTNFRLNDFRFRIELFQRDLATIEHVHLLRMKPDEMERYITSLAYDKEYYHKYGYGLKKRLDVAQRVEVECAGTRLVYESPMENAKLNIGDYSDMKNIGGGFPIGEVFTEAQDLIRVNGKIKIFAFAGENHEVKLFDPFIAEIQEGILDAPKAPEEFRHILRLIRQEEPVLVRELGLGLNPAMDKTHIVSDISAYERMKGLHMSLGAKHGIYKKPGLEPKHTRYHVDVFVDATRILVDGVPIFVNGEYLV